MNNLKQGTTVGGNIVYHKGNLKEVIANGNSGLVSLIDKQNINNIYTAGTTVDINITTQTKFDEIFCSGANIVNTSIFLKRKDTPYVLNNLIALNSNTRIVSDGAIVNRGNAQAKFCTNYLARCTVSSTAGNIFFTATSSVEAALFLSGSSVYIAGMIYKITSVSGVYIYVSSKIINNYSNEYLYLCTENIYTEGWTFDGQNSILSGNLSETTVGGAFHLITCVNSIFKATVRNCSVTTNGGAYYGDGSAFNIIENIYHCNVSSTSGFGGGVCNMPYSSLKNIAYCHSEAKGGGLSGCDYSNISNISNCTAVTGGGLSDCSYSIISDISFCGATYGGAINCADSSIISNIKYCTAYNGGGIFQTSYSMISDVTCCRANNSGGAFYNESEGTFAKVGFNTFFGDFSGNSAQFNNNVINNSTSSLSRATSGSTIYTESSTYSRQLINWN